MIDTLKLSSPYLSEAHAVAIEQACVRRQEIEIASGELRWEFVSGQLDGSYDHRVSLRIEREEWVSSGPRSVAVAKGARAWKAPCPPYLVVEGSVHKAMLGHNIFGGPLDVNATSHWFISHLSRVLDVPLPCAGQWGVQRVDWAEAYHLPSYEACSEFISGLNMARFPRRKVIRFGDESLMSPGTTTAVKIYHKGPEFYAHDGRRLRRFLELEELAYLQEQANCILRLEVSIKAKKLTADFEGKKPQIVQVTQSYLEEVHDREVARLLREAEKDVEIVRTYHEVSRRLHAHYDTRLANTLLGTWVQLGAVGEKEVRRKMAARTWYWQRKKLTEAAVSWHATDVQLEQRHSAVPRGFSPIRGDFRRLTKEADVVARCLQSVGRFDCCIK